MQNLITWFHTPPEDFDEELQDQFIVSNYGAVLCFIVHLLFLVFFIATDIKIMAYFNIASIMIFAVSFVSARVGKFLPLMMTISTLEILLHAATASFVLGLQSGFHLYLVGASLMWLLQNIPLRKKLIVAGFSTIASLVIIHLSPPSVAVETISPALMQYVYLFNAMAITLMLMAMILSYHLSVSRAKAQLKQEFERSEQLLHNILPPPIAKRLKDNEQDNHNHNIADGYPVCSVLFADIVGFTEMSQQLAPDKLVSMLNEIFSHFDGLAEKHGLEKIKTIGDAYMVASGIPTPDGNHAKNLANFSLDMQACMQTYSQSNGLSIEIRIGIHSGPAVAGVIGKKKFIYDIWGDTVNTAARMESHGKTGEIHISNLTKELLGNDYAFHDRGEIQVKGKGPMRTWLLKGAAERSH